MAYILSKLQRDDKGEINKIWKLGLTLIAAGVPIVLIAVQPDYGTVMAFVVGVCFMLFAAGIQEDHGYNLIQSKIAIGSGKLLGMGILMGNQTQLRISIPKNNRLYFLSYWGRDGVCSCSNSYSSLYGDDN